MFSTKSVTMRCYTKFRQATDPYRDDLNNNKSDCITNVLLKNLQPLSITERPFHCTDLKKKEWFVKDELQGGRGQWRENHKKYRSGNSEKMD